jgi:redox-sensitive bicupin YhaK (pirin superfamily)
MKKLLFTRKNHQSHWVGDGFPVRSIFSYTNLAPHLSPFLLLDYAGPAEFPPTEKRLGVGEHPHRGFETVSIVYSGEVEHRDSTGAGGTIGPGDVQWMTAASGIIHEEFHGRNYAKTGGTFEMIQLWVNLPASHKMSKPRYQEISGSVIPEVLIPESGGNVRVIAGQYREATGPAMTFTPINLWDIELRAGAPVRFEVPAGHTTSIFILRGKLKTGEDEIHHSATLCILDPAGDSFTLEALEDSRILFMGGMPLNEPIVGYGPFVMNTEAEIQQAFRDYHSGKFTALHP